VQGICKLCNDETILKESHFIPKFIGKWVKKTGVTGYLREKNKVHKRAQDLAKEYWLCGNCETLFSGWERSFANKVFYPFVEQGKSTANYDSWMAKFCASLSWRTLTFIRSKNSDEIKSREYNNCLESAQKHWAHFVLNKEKNLNQFEQHVYPLDAIQSTNIGHLPENINRYFMRTMAMDIVGNSTDIYTYTKLPQFIIMGVIKAKGTGVMRSSRIALNSGKIYPREYRMPDGFDKYIIESASKVTEAYNQIPEKHRDGFDDYIIRNPEKAANSKLIEAFLHDYRQFGDEVFR
jgi:hypothetical protein